MFVEKELFVIPNDGNFILYAPLKHTAVAVTGGVIRDLQKCESSGDYPHGQIRDILLKTGIISENIMQPKGSNDFSEEFKPTKVTLFPTSDCGLRCVYCYASAGVMPKVMDFSVAKAAVNLIINNALAVGNKSVSISFHGGGEPLYGASRVLVCDVVAYAKNVALDKGLKISFSCATNGVLSKNTLNWIAENINRLNLSVDGPPDIQDIQRPLKNGQGSSRFVENTIAFLEEKKVSYGIRSTITRSSVNRLMEIVEYLHRIALSASLHLEPLFSCGRCVTTGTEAPDQYEFTEAFLKAKDLADTLGIELYNSGAAVDKCDEYFCGAARGNFCITPWGNVTSCYEVSLPTDKRSDLFFFGAFDSVSQTFNFSHEKLARLRERRVTNITECSDCFLKYACAGDCLAKSFITTGLLNGGFRCEGNRRLGIKNLVGKISPISNFISKIQENVRYVQE